MNLTLMQLLLIVALVVCFIIPTLYAIVITVLFVSEKHDCEKIVEMYDELKTRTERLLEDKAKREPEKKDKIKAGFALPNPDGAEEQKTVKKEEKVA